MSQAVSTIFHCVECEEAHQFAPAHRPADWGVAEEMTVEGSKTTYHEAFLTRWIDHLLDGEWKTFLEHCFVHGGVFLERAE